MAVDSDLSERRAQDAVAQLQRAGVVLDAGLTEAELRSVERRFGFEFAADHAAFLRRAVPVDGPPVRPGWISSAPRDMWPDWRHDSDAKLNARLVQPLEGVLGDVQGRLGFWPTAWGDRPQSEAAAQRAAKEQLFAWSRLVPIFSHRYLHAAPCPSGAPVLSVHQTDIISYGDDLADYVWREFGYDDFKDDAIDTMADHFNSKPRRLGPPLVPPITVARSRSGPLGARLLAASTISRELRRLAVRHPPGPAHRSACGQRAYVPPEVVAVRRGLAEALSHGRRDTG